MSFSFCRLGLIGRGGARYNSRPANRAMKRSLNVARRREDREAVRNGIVARDEQEAEDRAEELAFDYGWADAEVEDFRDYQQFTEDLKLNLNSPSCYSDYDYDYIDYDDADESFRDACDTDYIFRPTFEAPRLPSMKRKPLRFRKPATEDTHG